MVDNNPQTGSGESPEPAAAAEPPRRIAIAPAAFVDRVVSDPAAPPAVVLLSGYPGGAVLEDHTRLYLTPDLAFWLDIPAEAVLHVQEIQHPHNLFGAVALWVRQDAQVSGGNRWSIARG